MKLISCDNCAAVLDANKMCFSSESRKYKDDGTVDTDKFTLEGDNYIAFVRCPVCNETIIDE